MSEAPSQDAMLTIQVNGVTKRFGQTVAVDDVSFDVRQGEVVGFLGPNGSGKTTTMRLLTSYYTPDSGKVLIEGIDNQEHDLVTRQKIGYLPENNPLYGDMLVTEYLSFVGNLRGMSSAEISGNMDRVVDQTGVAEVFYRPINQLSKGYRQRVGLAQAMLHLPDILIMDEPTEGLDPNQRLTIRDLIRDLGREHTILLSTHVLREVEATCDRVLIISRGRIVAQGTVDELRDAAQQDSVVHVEVRGNGAEEALAELETVEAVEAHEAPDGRVRYEVSVTGERDIRGDVFELVTERGWALWELHQESGRLEDLFHTLTMQPEQQDDEEQADVDDELVEAAEAAEEK